MAHKEYVVKQGDCISSIAFEHGFFPDSIWNDPENSELKEKREDPNILFPGDVVQIRDKKARDESCATEKKHRFKRKGVPAKFRIRVMLEPEEDDETEQGTSSEQELQTNDQQARHDQPRKNVPYTLEIDSLRLSGATDEQGYIEHDIPPDAKSGKLILEPGTPAETQFPLQLGRLDPISEIRGVKQRLNNLGFDCGDETDELTSNLEMAVRSFQEYCGLERNGQVDATTRNRLKEEHGG